MIFIANLVVAFQIGKMDPNFVFRMLYLQKTDIGSRYCYLDNIYDGNKKKQLCYVPKRHLFPSWYIK